MVDYPEFLKARLDQLEALYEKNRASFPPYSRGHNDLQLADIIAKRNILGDWAALQSSITYRPSDLYVRHWGNALYTVIRHLCQPFADHPDYPGELTP